MIFSNPSIRFATQGDGSGRSFSSTGYVRKEVTVFAGAGGQYQVVVFAVYVYALLDELTHPGLVFGDFFRRGAIGGFGYAHDGQFGLGEQGMKGGVVKVDMVAAPSPVTSGRSWPVVRL